MVFKVLLYAVTVALERLKVVKLIGKLIEPVTFLVSALKLIVTAFCTTPVTPFLAASIAV